MPLSTLKPVACQFPPASGANGSQSKVSNVTMLNRRPLPSLQMKEKEKPPLKESISATSRREMVHLTAASIGLLSLLLPASAEARPRNATMRQKIMEKLEELRQKAGFSKPKDEGEKKKPEDEDEKKKPEDEGEKKKPKDEGEEKKPKDEGEGKSKVQNGAKGTKPNDEKKHATAHEKSIVPLTEDPSVPPLPGIINDKTVETILP